jgi:23S rRNA (uracil1939-C5)-methyltransferase
MNVVIESVVYPGRGLARVEGKVVFVPRTLPGERVAICVAQQHKQWALATLESVLEPSPDRIEPICPLAAICPGCAYQQAAYPAELRIKQAQYTELLSRLGGLNVSDPQVLQSPLGAPAFLAYRNKLVLHAGRTTGATQPVLGYVGDDNRSLVDVPCCPLAVEPINAVLRERRDDPSFLTRLNDEVLSKVVFRSLKNASS